MADLWVVLAVVAFFAICVAFVAGCDRIIGPDDLELDDAMAGSTEEADVAVIR